MKVSLICHSIGRIVSDALRSFIVHDGLNDDAKDTTALLAVGNLDLALSTQRSTSPIRLRDFARLLTEAIAVASANSKEGDSGIQCCSQSRRPLLAFEAAPK